MPNCKYCGKEIAEEVGQWLHVKSWRAHCSTVATPEELEPLDSLAERITDVFNGSLLAAPKHQNKSQVRLLLENKVREILSEARRATENASDEEGNVYE